jgi:hypothetical protein
MEDSFTIIAAKQVYTQEMIQYFNPFQVVGSVIGMLPINPYLIKRLDVEFEQGSRDTFYNEVKIRIELEMPMDKSWSTHMEYELQMLLKKAFTYSYGKKADKYWEEFQKGPIYFTKEFGNEITPD